EQRRAESLHVLRAGSRAPALEAGQPMESRATLQRSVAKPRPAPARRRRWTPCTATTPARPLLHRAAPTGNAAVQLNRRN
uniref:Uncharacterized protein n=1 Tax=Aegilops tauschii subsp. strangulata TaxID=200361 RepID=A0A453J3G6_AEGTS